MYQKEDTIELINDYFIQDFFQNDRRFPKSIEYNRIGNQIDDDLHKKEENIPSICCHQIEKKNPGDQSNRNPNRMEKNLVHGTKEKQDYHV